jgi:hypothetical protein
MPFARVSRVSGTWSVGSLTKCHAPYTFVAVMVGTFAGAGCCCGFSRARLPYVLLCAGMLSWRQ